MSTRTKLIAIVGAVIVALVVAWRLRGGDAPATGAGSASGSDVATGSAAADDPWQRPNRRRIGSAKDDDPTAMAVGTAFVGGQVRERDSHRPVAGAEVVFWGKGGERSTTSGDDGRYQLEVPFGSWSARAAVGEDALSSPAVVRVTGATAPIDLEVERLAHVHGTVTDLAGRPVSGAEVANQGVDKVSREALEATVGRSVLTDGSGRYRLAVVPGEVRLAAVVAGQLGHARTAAVAAGADVELDLQLSPMATVDGVVVDDQGAPVADAIVTAFVVFTDIDLNVKREVASGPDGKFVFVDLYPGRVDLHARTRDGAATPVTQMVLDHGDVHGVALRLIAGAPLTGRVTYADGRGVAGAAVTIRRMGLGGTFATASTDLEGRFASRAPAGEPLEITAKDEYGVARVDNVNTTAPVTLVIGEPGGIRGTVRTPKGEPITDVTIAIDRLLVPGKSIPQPAPAPQRFVTRDGHYEWPRLEPGTYDLTIRAPGMAPVRRAGVAVPDSAWAQVDVELAPGATLRGTVRTAGGAPIAGASVLARCTGDIAVTDAKGGFVLDGMPAGACPIAVTATGWAPAEASGEPGTALAVTLAPSGQARPAPRTP